LTFGTTIGSKPQEWSQQDKESTLTSSDNIASVVRKPIQDRKAIEIPQTPMSMIERILMSQEIFDFNEASDDIKLHIYILVIKEMLTILRKQILRTLEERTLIEFEDSLSKVIDGFMDLSVGSVDRDFNLNKIRPGIKEAYSHLSAALLIYREKEDKGFEYLQRLQNFRDNLFETLSQLEIYF